MATRFAAGSGSARRSALLMLDIDCFRDINARFGAAGGDSAIAATAAAFAPLFREGEVGARLSGDEFSVFLPGAGIDRALELGEKIRAAVEALRIELPSLCDGKLTYASLTVSVGAAASSAEGPGRVADSAALVAAADKALFRAKESGRNRVEHA